MKKILCLILASDTSPEHLKFQKIWKRFMKLHKGVDCYFYKGHPNLTQSAFLEDDTLWIRIEETFDTVYEKTLRAFEYFLPELSKYDFVYRSNLSTVVSFQHMIDFCASLPRTQCCAAVAGGIPESAADRNSLKYPRSFPGGNGFILSSDLVRRLVEDREPLDIQDDVTIGNALRRWGISIHEFVRPDFAGKCNWHINNMHLLSPSEHNFNPKKIMFTYRLRSPNRDDDVAEMSSLIKRFYGV